MRKLAFLLLLPLLFAGAASSAEKPYNFWIVSHGSKTDMFWSAVKNGAVTACQELKCNVKFVFSDYDITKQRQGLYDAYLNADGVGFSVTDEFIGSMLEQHRFSPEKPLVILNSNLFGQGGSKSLLTFIGQDDEQSARDMALVVLSSASVSLDPSQTQVLIFSENAGSTYAKARIRGIREVMTSLGFDDMLVTNFHTSDILVEYKTFAKTYAGAKDKRIIFTLDSMSSEIAARYLLERRDFSAPLFFGGFDTSPGMLRAVRELGAVTVDQQPFLQGYFTIYNLSLFLRYGVTADINTGGKLIRSTEDVLSLSKVSLLQ